MGKRKESKKINAKEISEQEDEAGHEGRDEEDKPSASIDRTMTVKIKKKKKHREKVDVHIEIMPENPNKVSPIIGYFPSGYTPFKNQLNIGVESENELKELENEQNVKLYKHVKRNKRLELVVSPDDSPVDFVGTNYAGEATTAEMCNFSLGVLDKSSNTLKIVPITANRILRLEPRVRDSYLLEDNQRLQPTAQGKAEKMRELTNKYSTTKTIRQAQKLESLRQTEDSEGQENLGGKIDFNSQVLEVAAATNDARNIPPHDLGASTPQRAYPLDKIIFKGEWDYLDEILQLLEAGEAVGHGSYPSFVCNRVSRLKDIDDEMEKRQVARILSYITHLVKFKDRNSAQYHSAKDHRAPKILSQKFNAMFADSDSKWLADEKRDLLVNYVLVLTLHADNFRTDPADIAKDLRMHAVALRRHYELLGCKIVREKQQSLATLPLPLQFPQWNRQRGKRKR